MVIFLNNNKMAKIQEDSILPWKTKYGKGRKLKVPGSIDAEFAKILKKSFQNVEYKFQDAPIMDGDEGETYKQTCIDVFGNWRLKPDGVVHDTKAEMNLLQIAMNVQAGTDDEFILMPEPWTERNGWRGREIVLRTVPYNKKLVYYHRDDPTKPIIFFLCYQVTQRRDDEYRKYLNYLSHGLTSDPRLINTMFPGSAARIRSALYRNSRMISENLRWAILNNDTEAVTCWWKHHNKGVFVTFLTPQDVAMDDILPDCPECGLYAEFTCSQCLTTKYCSRECQRSGWRRAHKNECTKKHAMPEAGGKAGAPDVDEFFGGKGTGVKKAPPATVDEKMTNEEDEGTRRYVNPDLIAGDLKPMRLSDGNTKRAFLDSFTETGKWESLDATLKNVAMLLNLTDASTDERLKADVRMTFKSISAELVFGKQGTWLATTEFCDRDFLSITYLPYRGHKVYSKQKLAGTGGPTPLAFIRCTVGGPGYSLPPNSPDERYMGISDFCYKSLDICLTILKRNAQHISPKLREELEKEVHPSIRKHPRSFTTFLVPVDKVITDPRDCKECIVCRKPKGGQCQKCKAIRYCGIECQRTDWKRIHKNLCFSSFQ